MTPMMLLGAAYRKKQEALAEALAKTTVKDAYVMRGTMPAYPPLYLATINKHLPPEPRAKASIEVDDGPGSGKTEGGSEASEGSGTWAEFSGGSQDVWGARASNECGS